jgi:hypothetical protein
MAGVDVSDILDDDAIGLDGADIQAMAKRQLAASTAAAIVIALSAILITMAPNSRHNAGVRTTGRTGLRTSSDRNLRPRLSAALQRKSTSKLSSSLKSLLRCPRPKDRRPGASASDR